MSLLTGKIAYLKETQNIIKNSIILSIITIVTALIFSETFRVKNIGYAFGGFAFFYGLIQIALLKVLLFLERFDYFSKKK